MGERQIFTKCAWRLVPFMGLLYLVNYIDWVIVGFAALTMNRDLGFSPAVPSKQGNAQSPGTPADG